MGGPARAKARLAHPTAVVSVTRFVCQNRLEISRRRPPRTAAAVGAALAVLIAGAAKSADTLPFDPRGRYNEALAYLDTDFDLAERMLSEARREAGTDDDVRFRATYNLGCLEVKCAEKLIKQQPQEALAHLHRAVDWFRDAVRLRPDDSDARHNLDVVLRRILVLADSQPHHDERDFVQRLDELIEAQQRVVSCAQQLVDRSAAASNANSADAVRGEVRQLAVQQQKICTDGQSVSRTARAQRDALAAKKDREKSPQDKARTAQLTGLVDYANRAEQRLGQAHAKMRRGDAGRAFRLAAAGLTELKRARDQLRGPVDGLDVILAQAASLAHRQAELNDDTKEAAAALSQPTDAAKKIGPLLQRQRDLESMARQIAAALHEQAKPPPASHPKQIEQRKPSARQCTKASKPLSEALTAMKRAGEQLSKASAAHDERVERQPQLDDARRYQDTALKKLVEALAALEPPQPQQQQTLRDQKQADQKPEPSQCQSKKADPQLAGLDPSRLLQEVRDRDAQRRRHNRDGRGRFPQEPVDKDW
jgi:hypothetical protein